MTTPPQSTSLSSSGSSERARTPRRRPAEPPAEAVDPTAHVPPLPRQGEVYRWDATTRILQFSPDTTDAEALAALGQEEINGVRVLEIPGGDWAWWNGLDPDGPAPLSATDGDEAALAQLGMTDEGLPDVISHAKVVNTLEVLVLEGLLRVSDFSIIRISMLEPLHRRLKHVRLTHNTSLTADGHSELTRRIHLRLLDTTPQAADPEARRHREGAQYISRSTRSERYRIPPRSVRWRLAKGLSVPGHQLVSRLPDLEGGQGGGGGGRGGGGVRRAWVQPARRAGQHSFWNTAQICRVHSGRGGRARDLAPWLPERAGIFFNSGVSDAEVVQWALGTLLLQPAILRVSVLFGFRTSNVTAEVLRFLVVCKELTRRLRHKHALHESSFQPLLGIIADDCPDLVSPAGLGVLGQISTLRVVDLSNNNLGTPAPEFATVLQPLLDPSSVCPGSSRPTALRLLVSGTRFAHDPPETYRRPRGESGGPSVVARTERARADYLASLVGAPLEGSRDRGAIGQYSRPESGAYTLGTFREPGYQQSWINPLGEVLSQLGLYKHVPRSSVDRPRDALLYRVGERRVHLELSPQLLSARARSSSAQDLATFVTRLRIQIGRRDLGTPLVDPLALMNVVSGEVVDIRIPGAVHGSEGEDGPSSLSGETSVASETRQEGPLEREQAQEARLALLTSIPLNWTRPGGLPSPSTGPGLDGILSRRPGILMNLPAYDFMLPWQPELGADPASGPGHPSSSSSSSSSTTMGQRASGKHFSMPQTVPPPLSYYIPKIPGTSGLAPSSTAGLPGLGTSPGPVVLEVPNAPLAAFRAPFPSSDAWYADWVERLPLDRLRRTAAILICSTSLDAGSACMLADRLAAAVSSSRESGPQVLVVRHAPRLTSQALLKLVAALSSSLQVLDVTGLPPPAILLLLSQLYPTVPLRPVPSDPPDRD